MAIIRNVHNIYILNEYGIGLMHAKLKDVMKLKSTSICVYASWFDHKFIFFPLNVQVKGDHIDCFVDMLRAFCAPFFSCESYLILEHWNPFLFFFSNHSLLFVFVFQFNKINEKVKAWDIAISFDKPCELLATNCFYGQIWCASFR